MVIKDLTPLVAMVLIAALVGYANHLGIDGAILSAGVAVIAGLGGWTGKVVKDRRQKPKGQEVKHAQD